MVVQVDATGRPSRSEEQWATAAEARKIFGGARATFDRRVAKGAIRRRLRAKPGRGRDRYEYAVNDLNLERAASMFVQAGEEATPAPPEVETERWVSSGEAQRYVGQLTYYVGTGEIRRAGERGSYVYALADLEKLAKEKQPATRKKAKRRDAGKKGKEREAQIELLTARLLVQQKAPEAEAVVVDTRADIVAFAKRRVVDTPHFHAIKITATDGGRFIVEIEQKKVDRYELGD
jgi:hypothetical protein